MPGRPDRARCMSHTADSSTPRSMSQLQLVCVEARRLLQLASPIIITQLSQMSMGVADTVMAGRVSAADLAGIGIGGNLFWPIMLLLSGVLMAVTPSVSQLHGAGREREAGEVVRQALWIALILGSLFAVALRHVEPLYHLIGVDKPAIPIATAYLSWMSWGLVPLMGYFTLRGACDGMSWTRPAMLIALMAITLKIPLNLLFIYGGTWNSPFGPVTLDPRGGIGCGLSSAIVMWFELLAMLYMVGWGRIRHLNILNRFSWPKWTEMAQLFRLGIPIGGSNFLEISLFSVVGLLIARISVDAVAAHQIAMSISSLAFMIPLALGMAATIRVGFCVGSRDYALARLSGFVALGGSLIVAVLSAGIVFFLRFELAGLYTGEGEVLNLAADLLIFVAVYQIFDDAQVTAIGSMRGFKDTRTPLIVAFVAYWIIALPAGAYLGLGSPQFGVQGFWAAMVLGLAVAAVVLILRYDWVSRRPELIERLTSF